MALPLPLLLSACPLSFPAPLPHCSMYYFQWNSIATPPNPRAPCRQVLEVVAGVKGVTDLEGAAEQIARNTEAMFFPTA